MSVRVFDLRSDLPVGLTKLTVDDSQVSVTFPGIESTKFTLGSRDLPALAGALLRAAVDEQVRRIVELSGRSGPPSPPQERELRRQVLEAFAGLVV